MLALPSVIEFANSKTGSMLEYACIEKYFTVLSQLMYNIRVSVTPNDYDLLMVTLNKTFPFSIAALS